jgi:hypothetical protein
VTKKRVFDGGLAILLMLIMVSAWLASVVAYKRNVGDS